MRDQAAGGQPPTGGCDAGAATAAGRLARAIPDGREVENPEAAEYEEDELWTVSCVSDPEQSVRDLDPAIREAVAPVCTPAGSPVPRLGRRIWADELEARERIASLSPAVHDEWWLDAWRTWEPVPVLPPAAPEAFDRERPRRG